MQLSRHLQIALNIGFQPRQLTDLITLLGSMIEKNEANDASRILSRILNG